jgi:hypothetical protein
MKTIVIALSLLASVATTASAQRGPAAEGSYGTFSSDPDPNVRFEFRRDAPWLQGG